MYGIRQSNINLEQNYTFSKGLKALLRQDPDIIMVGEIRDAQTAHTALEAAYTGHLVLSSLHTQNIQSTLLRLKHFKCDPFLVQYALRGIIAQKLTTPKNITANKRTLNQEILYLPSPPQKNIFEFSALNELGIYTPFDNPL